MALLTFAVPGAATVPLRACRLTVAASLPLLVNAMVPVPATALLVLTVSVLALMAPVCVMALPATSVTLPAVPLPLLIPETTTALASVN